jgi:cytochrome c oxidase subunit II
MRRIVQFVALGTVLGVITSALFLIAPWFPTRATEQSDNEYPLFIALTYVSFVILMIVVVAILYSIWKFRKRGASDLRDGDPTHGHTLLEVVWTAIPVVIVAFFGVWGAKTLDNNEAHAANSRVISVIGYSFGFDYRYDSDGRFTRNDGLYVPVGEAITLHMITPLYQPGTENLEVIHSFWVPEWGIKQDATPGVVGSKVATTWVKPTKVGTYEVQCTELCGSGHGEMVFKNIHVLTKSAFARWLAGAKRDAAKAQEETKRSPGLAVFNSAGCGGCHTFKPAKAAGAVGPDLDDVSADFARAKAQGQTQAKDVEGFLRESIDAPNTYVAKGYSPGVMPSTYRTKLGEKKIADLAAYLAKEGSGS